MKTSLSSGLILVSVNIEGSKHVERVLNFLRNAKPDVVCMQEVFRHDLSLFHEVFGGSVEFVRMIDREDERGVMCEKGIAIFSRFPPEDVRVEYYYRPNADAHFAVGDSATYDRVLLTLHIVYQGNDYRIGTTHFTWTPHGEASDEQRRDVAELLCILDSYKEGIVFCGDFNAPRGGEIFAHLAASYKDNLPPSVQSTLDPVYHRAPPSQRDHLAVDTIFSTPEYCVDHMEVVEGISDHKLLRAIISRNPSS